MDSLKEILKRNQSGKTSKQKQNNYIDEDINESASVKQGNAFDAKKESAKTSCIREVSNFQITEKDGFDRKMTNADLITDKPLEMQPKFRLRSSLRSSYFQRDTKKRMTKKILSNGCEELNFVKNKYQQSKNESKTINGQNKNCEIQNKLN